MLPRRFSNSGSFAPTIPQFDLGVDDLKSGRGFGFIPMTEMLDDADSPVLGSDPSKQPSVHMRGPLSASRPPSGHSQSHSLSPKAAVRRGMIAMLEWNKGDEPR